jgi:L-asparaginase II
MRRNRILTIEILRQGVVESRHRVHAAIVDRRGRLVHSWCDADFPTIPRSAIKPFQTSPLIETGAAEALDLCDEFVALACASYFTAGHPEPGSAELTPARVPARGR